MSRKVVFLFALTLCFSCNRQSEKNRQNAFAPTVVEAKGYVVPADSTAPPMVIMIDESKLKKIPVGKPNVVIANTNIHLAGKPKVVIAGAPRVCTPGQDTFLLPTIETAIGIQVKAGIPQVVTVKDASLKDQNPQNFSCFGKLQGLRHGSIPFMMQDKSGNIWFGTEDGVSKYDGKSFTHFTEKEGLANNVVIGMLEDKIGNIWFSTLFGGLSKYDGKSFTNFTSKKGCANTSGIVEDNEGNIWFDTYGLGVTKYDGKTFTHFSEKQGLVSSSVRASLMDKNGNFWFGTDQGISKYDGHSFMNFTTKEGLTDNTVSCITEDKKGNLWFGTLGGVTKYDGKTFTQFTKKEGLGSNNIETILEDEGGNIWIGTHDHGVSKYDGRFFTDFTEKEGLINNAIPSFFEDRSGTFWVGSYVSGVSKYDGRIFTHFTQKEGLPHNLVESITEDKMGNLWFGTQGGGVSKFNGGSFTNFTEKEGVSWQQGLSDNYIYSLLQDKIGNLWFGTSGGGIMKYNGKTFTRYIDNICLPNFTIMSLAEDKSGNLWFGTYGHGVCKYDGKTFTLFTTKSGMTGDGVRCITEDKKGNLWFGTDYGACKYDGKTFTHFTKKEGLINNRVYAILEDHNGNIWFGTRGGVVKYDGKTLTNFTEKEGLISNAVAGILQDKVGNLWFSTSLGLSKLTPEKLAALTEKLKTGEVNDDDVFFKNYGYEDGFIGIGCYANSICEAKDGTIWIGTNGRLTAYHPEGDIPDTIPPNIQITNIGLYNENIPWQNLITYDKGSVEHGVPKDTSVLLGNGVSLNKFQFDDVSKWYGLPQHLSLAYNNNYLTFNFVGIAVKSPKKVKYKYELEGIDENWSALTSRNEAPYGNLPQGCYTFKVKAMNGEGYWSNEFDYTFTIRPPWWKTWWFRTLVGLLILASIMLYIKWRERELKERQKILEHTVEVRTSEVVAEKQEVQRQKEIVEKEKEVSEELLLNILPAEVAEELKAKGSADAKLFDEVTVMFTDFVSFTKVSEKLTPQQLVDELHTCFSAFDEIISKYNIEKIKTMGDGFIAAAGLPVANANHAEEMVNAAMEICAFMAGRQSQMKGSQQQTFEIRIGIHSGPVVAGIVGVKKYAYDIWGDTVNTAARMEQNSVAGKINISQTTYELVKDKFNCEYRGEIDAKNKGMMKMYYVDFQDNSFNFH